MFNILCSKVVLKYIIVITLIFGGKIQILKIIDVFRAHDISSFGTTFTNFHNTYYIHYNFLNILKGQSVHI